MKVPRHRLAALFAERSLGRFNRTELSREIAAYLLEEGRVRELEPLLRDIMKYRAMHDIVEVLAYSAHPLNIAVKRDIERTVRGFYPAAKKVIITPIDDSELIGGVRLELAEQQLDLSVRAKLNKLKRLTLAGKD